MGTLASLPASPIDPPAPVDPEEAAGPFPELAPALVALAEDPPAPELLVLPLEAFDAPPLPPLPPVVALELFPHAHRPALSSTADTPRSTRVDLIRDR